jgi:hypothetical protein
MHPTEPGPSPQPRVPTVGAPAAAVALKDLKKFR